MKKHFLIIFLFLLTNILISEEFSIAIIPDSQKYVTYELQKETNPNYPYEPIQVFYEQMEYIRNNSVVNGGTIYFAIHMGDVVNNFSKEIIEWEKADYGLSILDSYVSFGIVPGNHDYDEEVINLLSGSNKKNKLNGGTYFNKYFGPNSKHYKGKEWYLNSYNNGMNSSIVFMLGKEKCLFLGLEIEPSDDVLKWAQNEIDNNKNIPTIITTHEYISYAYDEVNPGNSAFLNSGYRKGFNRNSPKEIWKKFISKNDQIFLVLCGHKFYKNEGEGIRVDVNDFGNKVYSILSDYQGRKEMAESYGLTELIDRTGDGWMRLLHFNKEYSQIHIETYSTALKRYEKDKDSDFIIKFDWNWESRFQNAKENNN